jgi:molybdopterin-guanine dinucleotide biosynthesis protein A
VLAGGQARRMGGGDKALLTLGAHTVLDELLMRLRPQVHAVAMSANGDPARFAPWRLPVLPDPAGAGPLAGVLAGLTWAEEAGADTLLSVPADTPFIPADLVARLGAAPACAASASGTHHPVALWPVAARAALARYLAHGGLRVSAFAAEIGMRTVYFSEAPDPFCNINTPDDLTMARRRVAAAGAPRRVSS